MKFIDLDKQRLALNGAIERAVDKVISRGDFIMGKEVHKLEERLADYAGVNHCISVSSGTDALLVSLMALGVGPGDEVITPAFSFAATCEVVALLGAKPVFVDVDPSTGNIDLSKVAPAITSKTSAIIPVSLYGQCPDLITLGEIASSFGVAVVEDAAQSFGASFKNKKSCSMTTMACTSFFPSKPLGAYGDGGAIFTNEDDLAEACKQIRVHGQRGRYDHRRLGICGRLDTIQAAILLEKLKVFDNELEMREVVAYYYDEMFDRLGYPRMHIHELAFSTRAQYTLRSEKRDEILKYLADKNIPFAVHYPLPLHRQIAYEGYEKNPENKLRESEKLAREVFSLPMHPYLTRRDQALIFDAFAEIGEL